MEPRFIYLEDGVDPLQFIVSLNLKRQHLTPGQLIEVGRIIREAEEEKARGRQAVAGGDKKSEGAKSLVENFPQAISEGKARDLAAAQVGMSGKTLDSGIFVMENGVPELQEALRTDQQEREKSLMEPQHQRFIVNPSR